MKTQKPNQQGSETAPFLVDTFGRRITYLRLSVTDRCDFRCIYCMAEQMQFMPRKELLSYEELVTLAQAFCRLGVSKIRVSGGEPLIRKNVVSLFASLAAIPGVKELCLTTNASKLKQLARPLRDAGVTQVNISLDSLKPQRFRQLTRHGDLETVLQGIDAAKKAGIATIKINSVLMRNYNLDEVVSLTEFALREGLDIRFIEEMPLGEIQSHCRNAEFISSTELKGILDQHYQLIPQQSTPTSGPARAWRAEGHSSSIGFISPHSDNFCASCNRVRINASGRLLLCLGNEHSLDLKQILRAYPNQAEPLDKAIQQAMGIKPQQHHFDLNDKPQILRFMNATGG